MLSSSREELRLDREEHELEKSTLRLRAYAALAITPEQVACAPQITPELRLISRTLSREDQTKVKRAVKSVNTAVDSADSITMSTILSKKFSSPYGPVNNLARSWPHYLAADEHPDANKVLLAYNSVPRWRGRDQLPIEAYCVAAKVSPLSILGIITGAIVRLGATAHTIIAAANQPRVVQKLVDRALDDDDDTRMEAATLLSKATGFLPAPRGAQTHISVAANASAAAAAAPTVHIAPSPEQTTRRLVDRWNASRGLPPAAPASLPQAIPDAEALEITLESEEDDDGS